MRSKLNQWAQGLKRELRVQYYAYRDPETTLISKVLLATTLSYAMCPIDLIPDFTPVLGYLDDLITLPLLIFFANKTIPEDIIWRPRKKSDEGAHTMKRSYIAASIIVFLWILCIGIFVLFVLEL